MPLHSAFLAVWTEPGVGVQLDEFQDWYENEHISLRLNHLPSFLTGARFHASDGLSPSWLAVYDVQDISVFNDESYTRLRLHRSSREASILRRLHTLDRRTCELVYDTGESDLTSSFRCGGNPTKALITHEIVLDDIDWGRWEEEEFFLPSLKKVKGWARTRVYRCIENFKSGAGVSDSLDEQDVPRHLAVHGRVLVSSAPGKWVGPYISSNPVELLDHDCFDAFKSAFNRGSLATFTKEYRQWRLYRAYPTLSQRNVLSQ